MTAPPGPGPARAAHLTLARIRHGCPGRLAARLLAGLALAEITLRSGAGPAPVTGTLAGIAAWLVITCRGDIAPPPGR
jgi:hypothetical protein